MRITLFHSIQTRKMSLRNPTLGFVTLLLAGLAGWILVTQHAPALNHAKPLPDQTTFAAATGIRIVRVALTAGGGLADIHYQVLDPDKAIIVHDRQQPLTLIQEPSGTVLEIPFHGHGFRQLHTGVIYRLHLWNTNGALKRGDQVTIMVGDVSLEKVVVQ